MKRPLLPTRADLPRDVLAGLTVGVSQVGNAMAYTLLAGVPPVHGLYATMAGTPVGALTVSSQRMAIVPTAALCLTAGGVLAGLPPGQRLAGLTVLTVATGAVMLVFGLVRAGTLTRFISHAVIVGFMLGVSVQIILGQLLALVGFPSDHTNRVAAAADLAIHPAALDAPTALVGAGTIVLVLAVSHTRLRLFAMALAVALATVGVVVLGLTSVAVIGDIAPIPSALPRPRLPDLSLAPDLLLPALALAIIGLVQGAGISRWVPNPDGNLGDASRDFAAQGLANLASGLFGGVVMGGSVQASGLNVKAGSRTRWSAFLAGLVVIAVVLVAAPVVELVPLAATAGILIVAAASAIRPREVREIWRADRLSAAGMAVTFVLVLAIPLQYAVLIGAALSLLKYVYVSSVDVHVVQVSFDAGGHPHESPAPSRLQTASVTVLDVYGALFYAAGPALRESLPAVEGAYRAVAVLRLRGRATLHSSTIGLLREYAGELAAAGGRLYLAGVGVDMRDQLERTGLLDELGDDALVLAEEEPYAACAVAERRGREWLKAAGAAGEQRPGGLVRAPSRPDVSAPGRDGAQV